MKEKYLIINADDFGMCHSANMAISELFDGGFITSSSLMVNCPYSKEAVNLVNKNEIGLHLTFTSEWDNYKWGSLTKLSSLEDSNGKFYKTSEEFQDNAKIEDVEKEIRAQFNKVQEYGLNIANVDNHMFSLSSPVELFYQTLKIVSEYNLAYRYAKEIPLSIKNTLSRDAIKKHYDILAFAQSLNIKFIDHQVAYPFHILEGETYEDFKAMFISVIKNIKVGISEMYTHPAIETDEIKSINPSWQKRVWETWVLQDKDVLKTIKDENIVLIKWKDISAL